MNPTNNKKFESLIYVVLWALTIAMVLLDTMRARSYTQLPLLDMKVLGGIALGLLPFIVLFAINNYILIPRLLKGGMYGRYFLAVLLVFMVIWSCQIYQFFEYVGYNLPKHPGPPHGGFTPLLPLPLFLDAIYDIMIVGLNLVIYLIFQHFKDRFEQEKLQKENAENQLNYLKAQINPHFYMNMLNNIHGMIELNPEKAQEMVIEMSGLMRYMLYESSRPEIELSAETGFIRNYLELMRVRYPEDVVNITSVLPDPNKTRGILVPPLLFLVFIENAFKHGISYTAGAFISVSLNVCDEEIEFCCMNSVPTGSLKPETSKTKSEGIGLVNVRRRLELIYHDRYKLNITNDNSVYTVNLTLPRHENKNLDNR